MSFEICWSIEMADQGSMDEFLSKEIDQNKVTALVGSLESQLASSTNKDSLKTVPGSTFNNNHISGNASIVNAPITSTPSVTVRPQQTVVSVPGLGLQSQAVASSKILPQNAAIINSISNSQIIGISSIINANSQNRTSSNSTTPLPNSSISNTPLSSATKFLNSSPSIRIVTNNTKPQNSILHTSPVQVSKQQFINSAISQSVTTVRPQPVTTARVNISASGASTAMHNLATIAAEQKPLTVLPNGSTHLQNVQHKDGSVITQQIIMKNEANHTVVKRELSPLVKSDIPMSNSVIQGLQQNMRQSTPIITAGAQQLIKGLSQGNNPALVALRTPHSQQHVVVRATVATTLANSSPSVQVVNASAASTPSTLRPNIAPQMRPVRITNPVRLGTQSNIAPRQQNPPGTITIPHGALLVRNESGQLVLVSASQTVLHQTPSSNSVITTVAPSGYRIQNVRPLTSQAQVRSSNSGQSIVTIQPQSATQQQQSIQVRAPNISTVVPTATLQQRPATQPTAVIGPNVSTITTGTTAGEMNKAMLENVKKCKNFLSTLIKLAANQPDQTVKNVRALIQGLIDGKVEPEAFTERLQHELQSSPQPYLVPFLKKSLPLLRTSMLLGRMTIDGVNPPPPEVAGHGHLISVSQPVSTTQQVVTATGTLTQRPVIGPRPTVPSIQQPNLRPTLGPASSKVAPIRQSAPQVTIAPGGNKIMVNAPTLPMRPQVTQNFINQVRPKITVTHPSSSPSMPIVRANKPITASTLMKPEQLTSPAPGQREKRKFESLKDGDDDINDVATMGGVNLSEESKNILATTNVDFIGAQTRSCKDEILLSSSPLFRKINSIAQKYNIDDISPDVVKIVSHATQERLRDVVSKLSVIAEHRVEIYKMDSRYEVESENKQKLKFLEELDKLEKKRHEEQEREKLLRAMKSRSKNEDPEQLKLKQKAKELQLAEAEELRQREANLTALAAIGPRKKRKLEFSDSTRPESTSASNSFNTNTSNSLSILRPRTKRVNLRDVQFLLETERTTRKSDLLYKTFLK
ncbi:transcription initiation factor TFIID subunit 4 [Biomphalaria glabrata]|nr:transcription initiation factor TFIID subunit 4-like [Biomphalaria glabrata]